MRRNINIQNYLPHREPMLMADEIVEIDETHSVTTFRIEESNIFTENGFLNEAGMIENCAQTCSTITGQHLFDDKNEKPAVIGFISNIKKVKIHGLPKVGGVLTTKAEFISQYENICNVASSTFSDGKLLMEAEIVMFIKKLES